MKILILGGTVFLGRYLVEEAQRRGHEVTLFNRGVHNPDLFPEVEKLRGDRYTDLSTLEGRTWDAAIDVSCHVPASVKEVAEVLASAVKHYTYISSKSVYADFSAKGVDESAPVGTLTAEQQAQVADLSRTQEGRASEAFMEHYGPLKALSEQAAEEAMPGRVLHVRAGLLVGPYDGSDRFTYWPRRVAQGGEVLAPGRPERGVQFIDVRDLALWIITMIEAGKTGVYNANGRPEMISMGQLLTACKQVSGSDAQFTWVDEQFLTQAGIGMWMEMPLWLPEEGEYYGFLAASVEKAIRDGLSYRPLEETIRDTLAWERTRPEDTQYRAGLKREREIEVLQAWHAREQV